MSGSLLINRAKASTATTGTGTVNLGSVIAPYQTWAVAGAATGKKYSYLIEDGNDWEVGEGTYTAGSPDTLTRTLIASSTGALLNLSGLATVACVASKLHFDQYEVIRLCASAAADGAVVTHNINSLAYVSKQPFGFAIDVDRFPFTHFNIVHNGLSNAAAATVTAQLVTAFASPTSPYSAAGNDLAIANASATRNSGWIARSAAFLGTGLQDFWLAFKGSTSTVDLTTAWAEIHLAVRN